MKKAAGIVRGASSPEIERHITSCAVSLWHSLDADRRARLMEGEADVVPEEVLLQHYREPRTPSSGRAAVIAPSGKRHWSAVAFDRFRRAQHDSIKSEMKRASQPKIKEMAWRRFAAMEPEEQKGYLPPGFEIKPRAKKKNGAGDPAPSTPAAAGSEAPAPSTPRPAASSAEDPSSTEKAQKRQPIKRRSLEALGAEIPKIAWVDFLPGA